MLCCPRKQNNYQGFTLIELLVVISIIALLVVVVVASIQFARARSRDSKRVQDLQQFASAIELYAGDHSDTYPPTPENIIFTSKGPVTISNGSHPSTIPCGTGDDWTANDINGSAAGFVSSLTSSSRYISTLSKDPTNSTFCYAYVGNPDGTVGAFLASNEMTTHSGQTTGTLSGNLSTYESIPWAPSIAIVVGQGGGSVVPTSSTLQSVTWSASSGAQYQNPRVNFGLGDQMPYWEDSTASEWCRHVSGQSYSSGHAIPWVGTISSIIEYQWTGSQWIGQAVTDGYPRFFICSM